MHDGTDSTARYPAGSRSAMVSVRCTVSTMCDDGYAIGPETTMEAR
jgi:hypothetical protein